MIMVFVGENSFLLREEVRMVVTEFVKDHSDFGLQKIDCSDTEFSQIQEAVQSMPFLAARKLVVLEQPGAVKQFNEAIDTLLTDTPDTIDVLIVEPAIDKRTSYYKWLKKNTDFHECKTLSDQELVAWLVSYAKRQGSSIAANDARYLLQRTGGTQEALANELAKLAVLGEKITKERIDELTSVAPQSKIFDLLDAAFSGDKTRSMELYQEQRAQKVQPQEIIAMIGWQLRLVALAKTAGKHDLVREGKLNPYAADKAKRIANRLPYIQLKKQVRDLAHLDAQSKSSVIDLDEALQTYIVNL